MKLAHILLIIVLIERLSAFRLQGVGVQGRLLCGEKALRNTKVKIYDVDRSKCRKIKNTAAVDDDE